MSHLLSRKLQVNVPFRQKEGKPIFHKVQKDSLTNAAASSSNAPASSSNAPASSSNAPASSSKVKTVTGKRKQVPELDNVEEQEEGDTAEQKNKKSVKRRKRG